MTSEGAKRFLLGITASPGWTGPTHHPGGPREAPGLLLGEICSGILHCYRPTLKTRQTREHSHQEDTGEVTKEGKCLSIGEGRAQNTYVPGRGSGCLYVKDRVRTRSWERMQVFVKASARRESGECKQKRSYCMVAR